MDACHLLLGRPWQFDRKVFHDGYKNTYTFVKDGVNVILGPSKYDHVGKNGRKNGASSMEKFMKAIKGETHVYALVINEQNLGGNIPLAVEPLMQEFSDVIPEELPSGLPPMMAIQELQRQVLELMEKGLIRESMSHSLF